MNSKNPHTVCCLRYERCFPRLSRLGMILSFLMVAAGTLDYVYCRQNHSSLSLKLLKRLRSHPFFCKCQGIVRCILEEIDGRKSDFLGFVKTTFDKLDEIIGNRCDSYISTGLNQSKLPPKSGDDCSNIAGCRVENRFSKGESSQKTVEMRDGQAQTESTMYDSNQVETESNDTKQLEATAKNPRNIEESNFNGWGARILNIIMFIPDILYALGFITRPTDNLPDAFDQETILLAKRTSYESPKIDHKKRSKKPSLRLTMTEITLEDGDMESEEFISVEECQSSGPSSPCENDENEF